LTTEVTENARKLIDAFFPGPLTIVLKKAKGVPTIATAGLDTIGISMPGNTLARDFVIACGIPLVAPSANRSGRPSPTTWQAVVEDLDGRIDCILQGDPTEIGLESTVVDCTGDVPILLRLGAVSREELRTVIPQTITGDDPSLKLRSPGLRYKHYSPKASVVMISDESDIGGTDSAAYIGTHQRSEDFALMRVCATVEDYAHSLFEFFRECDRRDIKTIYCDAVKETGLGSALMDRLRRAAAK
jgi:L-threonylcarbamoyladenylate synthase